jgi:hypothetical protein
VAFRDASGAGKFLVCAPAVLASRGLLPVVEPGKLPTNDERRVTMIFRWRAT